MPLPPFGQTRPDALSSKPSLLKTRPFCRDLFLRETPQPRRLDTLNQTHKGVDGILAKVQSERNVSSPLCLS